MEEMVELIDPKKPGQFLKVVNSERKSKVRVSYSQLFEKIRHWL